MGRKRKRSSFSDEIDYDGEADDMGYDLRLIRRLRRRCIVNKDINLNSVGKNCFGEGKHNGASKKTQEANCANLVTSDDDGGGEDFVDADYKKYLDSLSSVSTGDDFFSNNRIFESGDHESMSLLNNDADTNHVRSLESNYTEFGGNREEDMDACYRSYLDILALEDENAYFIDRGLDVNAANGFIEKINSGDDLVEKGNNDSYDANNFSKKNTNCIGSVAIEIDADPIENGTSGNVGNSCEDRAHIDVDGGSFKTQSGNNDTCQNDDLDNNDSDYDFFLKNMVKDGNGTCSNFSEDSGRTDVDSQSPRTRSRNNDASQNDDLDDNDPDYDFCLKNVREDGNGMHGLFSDGGSFQTQSGNNDTCQNDDLGNSDPDYDFFLRNLRKDGASFVLEIPVRDGFSQIIKYELGDECGVENPDTTRSSQAGSFEHDMLDESYEKFTKFLKNNDRGLVVYMPESGEMVVYDEDEESSSDSDVVILETNPFSQSCDIPKNNEERDCNKGASRNDSWFREKVLEILRKPFDQNEYNRLLQEAFVHKPVTEERDLRDGRIRKRTVNVAGKSYLDVHKDLNRMISSAGSNQPKVLNLLRGFFCWLQNTPHEVFKPWEDELCLQVLPSPEVASHPRCRI